MCVLTLDSTIQALLPPGADRSDATASTTIAAGALGGIGYWGLCYPADTVKSYIQTSSAHGHKSFMSVLSHLVRTRGTYFRLVWVAGAGAPVLQPPPFSSSSSSSSS